MHVFPCACVCFLVSLSQTQMYLLYLVLVFGSTNGTPSNFSCSFPKDFATQDQYQSLAGGCWVSCSDLFTHQSWMYWVVYCFFFLYFPSKQRWYCSKKSYIIYINPWFLFYRIPNQDAIPNQQKTSVQKVGQKTPPNSAGIRKHIHTKSLPNCWFEPPISKKMYIVKIEKTHLPQHYRVFSAIVCWVAGSPNYPRGPIQKNLSLIVFQLSSRKWPKATPISSFLRELIYQNLQKLGTLGR